jgi:predicted nucleotidyltransferase
MSEKMNITSLSMKILLFLARHPNQEFYVREIATSIKKSVGGSHGVLKTLERQGFILGRKSGKNLYYRVNDANPSVKNFKIFMSTIELYPLIHDLKKISEKIILFGSVATGEDTAGSDIDLFILSTQTQKVKDFLKKRRLGREIQAVVVTTADYIKLKEKDKAFYQEINKGLVVWENKSE